MKTKIRKPSLRGFTLIELVIVMLLIAVLAAVAIPNFIDLRVDAKNASTFGALGAMRAAIAIGRASIALREDPANNTPVYPTALEMQANGFNGSHPILSSTSVKIMDPSSGIPPNPWSLTTIPLAQQNSIFDCNGLAKATILSTAGIQEFGWCYNQSTGQIWANSTRNSGNPAENSY